MSTSTWRIRYSSAKSMGWWDDNSAPTGFTSMVGHADHFDSREQAVAFVLAHLDARIVDTAAELSTTEPTCWIEEVK